MDPLEKFKDLIPSRVELAGLALYGWTPEQRHDANVLLKLAAPLKEREGELYVNHCHFWLEQNEQMIDESPQGKRDLELLGELAFPEVREHRPQIEAQATEGTSMKLIRGQSDESRPKINFIKPPVEPTQNFDNNAPLTW